MMMISLYVEIAGSTRRLTRLTNLSKSKCQLNRYWRRIFNFGNSSSYLAHSHKHSSSDQGRETQISDSVAERIQSWNVHDLVCGQILL